MFGKDTLKLEDDSQMLQNNELMKKTDSSKEPSGLVAKEKKGRSQSRGTKKGNKVSSGNNDCYYCKQ